MDDYLGWLTAGLVLLWILGAYDARAVPLIRAVPIPGIVHCESPPQCAIVGAPPFYDVAAHIGIGRRQPSSRS
jgi:hypothetical protein